MKAYYIFLPIFMFALFACNGGASNGSEEGAQDQEQTEELPMELRGTVELDLTENGLPFAILIPDTAVGYPEVIVQSYGDTEVHVGKYYQLRIAEGGDLAGRKLDMKEDGMFTHTIIEEGDDYVLYKSEIKDSYLDPNHHFYMVKSINGITYEIENMDDGEETYSESAARTMLEAAKRIKSTKAEA